MGLPKYKHNDITVAIKCFSRAVSLIDKRSWCFSQMNGKADSYNNGGTTSYYVTYGFANDITHSIIGYIESDVKNYLYDGWAGRSLYAHGLGGYQSVWLPVDLPSTEPDSYVLDIGMCGVRIEDFGFVPI